MAIVLSQTTTKTYCQYVCILKDEWMWTKHFSMLTYKKE